VILKRLSLPGYRIASGRLATFALPVLIGEQVPSAIRLSAARVLANSQSVTRLGLGELSADRLLAVARDPGLRMFLKESPDPEPQALIDAGGLHADLGLAVLWRLRRADTSVLGEALYRTIVLDRAGAASRLNVALSAATVVADSLAPQQGRAVFTRCLQILGRRLDPYDRGAARSASAARQAAAAILARDSELDELVINALGDQEARANVQMIVASALKEQPDQAAERFVPFLKAFGSSSEQAIRFAEDCDADRGTLRAIVRKAPGLLRRWATRASRWPRTWIQFVVSLAVPPTAAVVLAIACKHASKALASAGIGPGVAIGALALLAAVHILSVQLAAQRLPGPIAAAVVATPVTLSAYATGVLMLVASTLGQEQTPPSWKPSLVASGLLVIFVAFVGAATFLSLRSTGAAAASEAVGRRRIGQARRTGGRAGKLHQAAADWQRAIDAHPCLRRFGSAQETTQRYPIRMGSSGYLHIDPERLRAATQRPQLTNGNLRLDLLVPPGVAVTPGQEVASLVPIASADLEEDDLRAAELPFKVSDERRLERFAELCVALCSQLPRLVRAGDPGGARRILHALLELLRAHLDRDAIERGDFVGTLPLSPALTQVIDQARASLAASTSEGERDILARLLLAVLDFARKNDGVVTLVAGKLSSDAHTLTDFEILYNAGRRAVLLESPIELALVQRSFPRVADERAETARYANEAAGRLVAYCAAVAPRLSRAAWTRWWTEATRTSAPDRIQIALRIGAAALPVANLSLAVEISLAMAGQDFSALITRIRSPEMAAFEGFLSEAYGRLLGTDAEQRIVDFVEFARSVTASVAAPVARAPTSSD
jgi:hypothetical protein